MSSDYKILWKLIADLSDDLRDEGCDYSPDGLDTMRSRVANALPASERPKWLLPYCNPAVLRAPDPNPAGLSRTLNQAVKLLTTLLASAHRNERDYMPSEWHEAVD